jgi:hypothetical protein
MATGGGLTVEPIRMGGVEIPRDAETCARCIALLEARYDEEFFRYVRSEYWPIVQGNKDLGERLTMVHLRFDFDELLTLLEGGKEAWSDDPLEVKCHYSELLKTDEGRRERLRRWAFSDV